MAGLLPVATRILPLTLQISNEEQSYLLVVDPTVVLSLRATLVLVFSKYFAKAAVQGRYEVSSAGYG